MTAPHEDCNLSNDDPPFNPAFGVRKNKIFPQRGAHFEVHAALEETLKLPSTHASLIPGPDLPISDFLELSFPKISSTLLFSTSESWFSNDAPTTSVDCLLSQPIPPLRFLDDLSKAVGQAWLDSHTSIIDPWYNDGQDRLLLWAPTVNVSGLELTSEDAKLFEELNSAIVCLNAADKLSHLCKKSKGA
jgi:hypothetical protein